MITLEQISKFLKVDKHILEHWLIFIGIILTILFWVARLHNSPIDIDP